MLGNRITKTRLFRGVHFALEISNSRCSEISSQTFITVNNISKSVLGYCVTLFGHLFATYFITYFFIMNKEFACVAVYVVLGSMLRYNFHIFAEYCFCLTWEAWSMSIISSDAEPGSKHRSNFTVDDLSMYTLLLVSLQCSTD